MDFLQDDTKTEFETYLPVQLDATCNGFQHLSLLSEQSKLYKGLNLINDKKGDSKDVEPADFYNFILLKSQQIFRQNLNNEQVTPKNRESCKRLLYFTLDRDIIKKSIMTIPYNAKDYAMTKHMKSTLKLIEIHPPKGT